MFYAALDVSLRSVAICIVDHEGAIRLERPKSQTWFVAFTRSASRSPVWALRPARSPSI